jgi:uncharacterized RDD family membrane protein YckC
MMRSMTVDDEPREPVVPLTADNAGDTRVIGLRVVQFALDVVLVQVVAIAVAAAAAFLGVRLLLGGGRSLIVVFVFALVWLWLSLFGWVLVTVLWPALHDGQTPAMRWFRLRVVTLRGQPPRMNALIMRCVLTLVDGFPFGLIGLVVMHNSKRQQRLGDIAAGTLVVRDRP